MLNLIKASKNDTNFINSFNLKSIDNVWIIYNNNIPVGVVEYTKEENYEEEHFIHIEYIHIISKFRKNKIATNVINMISEEGKHFIYGDCSPNNIAFKFWQSLGADFDGEEININKYIKSNCCIPFSI